MRCIGEAWLRVCWYAKCGVSRRQRGSVAEVAAACKVLASGERAGRAAAVAARGKWRQKILRCSTSVLKCARGARQRTCGNSAMRAPAVR